MNITFDTNTWEPAVQEEKPHLIEIKNAIRDGKIRAYICEITLNLEAIQKVKRAKFFENYKPRIPVEELPPENGEFRMQFSIAPNTEVHPGIHPKQWDKILKARDLGFKILRMTNIGTVRTKEIPDDMYVQHDDLEEFWRYAELLDNCNDFIMRLGCGGAAYEQFKAQYNLVGSGGQTLPKNRIESPILQVGDENPPYWKGPERQIYLTFSPKCGLINTITLDNIITLHTCAGVVRYRDK